MGDKEAFKATVERLYHDRELARKLGVNGREQVIENYTVGKMGSRILELYKTVCEQ